MALDIMEALTRVTTSIKTWVDENKVEKVSGKGLSSNDYTNTDKNKVANIANKLVVLDGKLYLAKDGIPLEDTAVTLAIVDNENKAYTLICKFPYSINFSGLRNSVLNLSSPGLSCIISIINFDC